MLSRIDAYSRANDTMKYGHLFNIRDSSSQGTTGKSVIPNWQADVWFDFGVFEQRISEVFVIFCVVVLLLGTKLFTARKHGYAHVTLLHAAICHLDLKECTLTYNGYNGESDNTDCDLTVHIKVDIGKVLHMYVHISCPYSRVLTV